MYNLYLIGKNISHSKSPELYNEYFAKHNMNYHYSICEVDELESFINRIKNDDKVYAFNVTSPYKTDVLKYLDSKDETCEASDSCNLVVLNNGKLKGYSTDGDGFFISLIDNGINPDGFNITVIGNGGAAKSIIAASKKYKINDVYNITHKISDKLFKHSDIYTERIVSKKLRESEIIVNASNVGFNEDKKMPLPDYILNRLIKDKQDFCFVDIIYNPLETTLLKYMREHDVYDTFNGEPMLKAQFKANVDILFPDEK